MQMVINFDLNGFGFKEKQVNSYNPHSLYQEVNIDEGRGVIHA